MPELTSAQARERFAGARLARLATVGADGRPHLVPVVFALTGDTVVTAVDHKPKRTMRLRRLDNIRAHPAVCLLVDDYDENWDHLWWARGDGTARVLPPADESALSADYIRLLVDTYPVQYGVRPPRGPVVEITVGRWSGWRAG
ncbi:TIGR03668 family PPOX class F420-dependent oxidoreductase [Streptomyces sp. CY1]|uniref:TIGR03668 family PPOX class F420-dependent oxidoreductase n=1 Tax=Streptomyces sp. CY1 TaxID=3388313 RepID=UPI0039A253DC